MEKDRNEEDEIIVRRFTPEETEEFLGRLFQPKRVSRKRDKKEIIGEKLHTFMNVLNSCVVVQSMQQSEAYFAVNDKAIRFKIQQMVLDNLEKFNEL